MRYWFNTLLGIGLASAAVAAIAWCTRALVERSLCPPAGDLPLACSAESGQLGAAIAVCALLVIPVASLIFMHRTQPRSTPLGALALGLAATAAGGAALYAAIPSHDTTVQVSGYITAGVLLSIGPFFVLGGIVATGRRRSTSPLATATAAAIDHATAAAGGGGGGAVFLSGADIRAGAIDDATRARAAATTSGFGALAAQLAQVAAAKERTGAGALAATLRQLDDLHAAGLLNSADHARMRDEINARVREL